MKAYRVRDLPRGYGVYTGLSTNQNGIETIYIEDDQEIWTKEVTQRELIRQERSRKYRKCRRRRKEIKISKEKKQGSFQNEFNDLHKTEISRDSFLVNSHSDSCFCKGAEVRNDR